MERAAEVLGGGRWILKVINLWSELGCSRAEKFMGLSPEQQTRSRVWPFECVGKSMSCFRPKLLRQEVKSHARVQFGLSICILKSPRRIILEDKGQRWARKTENSWINSELCLGGRYIVANMVGVEALICCWMVQWQRIPSSWNWRVRWLLRHAHTHVVYSGKQTQLEQTDSDLWNQAAAVSVRERKSSS